MQLKYDIPFIFAEVNADVVYWVVQGDGMEKQSIRSSDVGKYISTKRDIAEGFGQCSWVHGVILGNGSVQGWEWDSMTLVSPF